MRSRHTRAPGQDSKALETSDFVCVDVRQALSELSEWRKRKAPTRSALRHAREPGHQMFCLRDEACFVDVRQARGLSE